ncbi:Bet v1-like protein [Gonapodya prolifera JEL478]|uniref:Bet v1-like protein n=1 Tax=Gonapodya prolifera (strain JEL478) TaxID=1344416 RepID=A0A139ANE0_GONPJ|nr:Bet v1-like protein [Gonapodya prolifera JEL478]|eukprot:KXS18260.1 Bet v1-like protein [Gonapodya prolifera JEL478]
MIISGLAVGAVFATSLGLIFLFQSGHLVFVPFRSARPTAASPAKTERHAHAQPADDSARDLKDAASCEPRDRDRDRDRDRHLTLSRGSTKVDLFEDVTDKVRVPVYRIPTPPPEPPTGAEKTIHALTSPASPPSPSSFDLPPLPTLSLPPVAHRHSDALHHARRKFHSYLSDDNDQVRWTFVSESKGTKVYTAVDPANVMPVVKAVAMVDGFTPEELLSGIGAVNEKCLWDSRSETVREIERLSATDCLVHIQIAKQFPLAGREAVTATSVTRTQASSSSDDNAGYAVESLSTSVVDPRCPADSSRVLATLHISGWSIRPIKSRSGTAPSCAVTYLVHVDIGGSIPGWVLKLAVSEQAASIASVSGWLEKFGVPPYAVSMPWGSASVADTRWNPQTRNWTAELRASESSATVLLHIPTSHFPKGAEVRLPSRSSVDICHVAWNALPAHYNLQKPASETSMVLIKFSDSETITVEVIDGSSTKGSVSCNGRELDIVTLSQSSSTASISSTSSGEKRGEMVGEVVSLRRTDIMEKKVGSSHRSAGSSQITVNPNSSLVLRNRDIAKNVALIMAWVMISTVALMVWYVAVLRIGAIVTPWACNCSCKE